MTRQLRVYEGGKLTHSQPLAEDGQTADQSDEAKARAAYRKRIAVRIRQLKSDPESSFNAVEHANAEFRFRVEVETQNAGAAVTPFPPPKAAQDRSAETADAGPRRDSSGREVRSRIKALRADASGVFNAAEAANRLYRNRLAGVIADQDEGEATGGAGPHNPDKTPDMGERLHPNYRPGVAEEVMASVGLYRPTGKELVRAYNIVRQQIVGPLASLNEVQRVDALTKSTIWVHRRQGEVSGCLATLALTRAGRDALIEGGFNPNDIKQHWVAKIGQPLAGFYCWSYAGVDQSTRSKLAAALKTLIDQRFPDLPFFGRDSTEAGAQIMSHLGFVPFDDAPHLFWRCCSVMDHAQ
jgi:hypothetical protein